MISRFELHVALRYLRSRRASRLLSLITVIRESSREARRLRR